MQTATNGSAPSRTAIDPARVVLVVEDDEAIAWALHDVLCDEGYDAVVAGTVASAVEHARRTPPALVLLDWNLPDGSGEDVVRAIRPLHASVPIIVVSAMEHSLRDSQRVEATERVSKPFDLARLVAMVNRYLA